MDGRSSRAIRTRRPSRVPSSDTNFTGPIGSPPSRPASFGGTFLQRVGERDVDRDVVDFLQGVADGGVEVAVLLEEGAGTGVVAGPLDLEQLLREGRDRRVELLRIDRELPFLAV